MIVVADTCPLAHLAGLLNFDEALDKLRSTNFRLSADVERLARRRLSGMK